ncbi:MAG: NAD(P)-dependent oxidoreductase [Verrucomicrobia bacterium]|nr:NAD(P)-dependent oxidoreductase [Verrucomicrobiota bacterium]MBU1735118.1 NAD(P)-dependent oxidoreductase [Verrucomicrobiota bacterium]MBU1856366.1 NAD(P)-dependent oxidoreductase [Verrucomicrobiota bacterium]
MSATVATKKILVTGAAGYIGSVLVPELLRRGHAVTAVDNFMYHQTSLLDCCQAEALTLVRGDVRDMELMRRLLAGADAVIPLACLVGAPVCAQKPPEARSINLDAIKALIDMSSRHQAFILPITNSGYGLGKTGLCTEESPLRPVSLYGRLKVELEQHLLNSGHAVSLRLATAFGISPRMRLDLLVNDFTYRAVTDRFVVLFEAHFKRNYIHVRDVARAFMHAFDNFDRMKNEPYNVGLSDANLSKMELCLEIKKQVPAFTIMEAPIGQDPDQRNYMVSNAKIEATGFEPQWSLPKGIAELIKGYQIVQRRQFSNV